MTLLWEVCGICERPAITKSCSVDPETSVCPHCCVACTMRRECPRPSWLPEVRAEAPRRPVRRVADEKTRILEDLLKRLEGA